MPFIAAKSLMLVRCTPARTTSSKLLLDDFRNADPSTVCAPVSAAVIPNTAKQATVTITLPVGAITPLCLGSLLPVFFDIGLKRFEEVVTAGGSTHAAIRIPLTRFAQLTGATWVDVCKEM